MLISRRQLLYAMLAALGLAAISGIAALLFASGDVMWRFAGTAFATAVAAAIMMPMSAMADRPKTRVAGLLGMCIAVFELALAATIIWGDIFPSAWREFLAETGAAVGGCGLVAVVFIRDLQSPGWGTAVRVGAGACIAACGCFVSAAVAESFFGRAGGGDLFGTGMSLFWSGILAAVALIGVARPDPRPWRWIGPLAAAAGFAMAFYGIWIKEGGSPAFITAAYGIAATVAHAIVSLRLALTPGQQWVRTVAIASAAASAASATYVSYVSRNDTLGDFDPAWRLLAGAGLLCVSATMALAVIMRLNRKPAVELRAVEYNRVFLTCPRCEMKLNIPTGGALCQGCKLHINVSIAGTLCTTCGYDLTDLKTNTCPECGSPVPQETKGKMGGVDG